MRLWFAGLLALLLAACGHPVPVAQEAYVFGTRVEVQVAGVAEAEAQAALGEVLREFDRLHRAYHAWQPSELTALNEAIAAGRPHKVSAELAGLIRTAQRLAGQGDGLFDPGIGRIIALWGFQSDEFKPALPDAAALQQLVAAKPSIADLSVADDGTVTSKNPDVALDFGGYLKGVALDRAAALLKRRGIHDALINIGGNVLALGSKGGVPWRVGIRHPRVELAGEGVIATLELHDGEAIGTSGDYQRFFELDGKRYCHLIDPRTGAPAQGTQSLTVLIPPGADAGMRSDVLTKPLFISNDRWRELARRLDVTQVLRIDAQGRVYVTPAMQARLHFTMDNLTIGVVQ
ncbi:FAD:protein FMN transferase [Sulfuricystis thermophila]|uniref:FAD:protein FMN transferase n=1 Tax=Sulfuricystis thermophila TaxID=2496847 RepID=UPI0010360213|nr:FAD:protein FMN transferase [Sulfuricystis thermophila]